MSVSEILQQIEKLSLDEQYEILNRTQDRLEGESVPEGEFTQEDFDEWERRYQDHLAHPEKAQPWREVIAELRGQQ